MSASLTNTPSGNSIVGKERPALFRIAVPSFRYGWRKSNFNAPKKKSLTREDFQSVFSDELRRPFSLTGSESKEYEKLHDLRAALYSN